MADSLGAILEAGKWEKALFLTYSLSLTFFESMILRALRKSQCSEVWVITDAEGYRSSLMERRSDYVGYEYRLIPVGLRKGAFHPKCCYLVGRGSDILVVGSGNLTFGGFGRNLEVFEVLSSELHSECFSSFGEFLNGLQSRSDLICPDLSWTNDFAQRARDASFHSKQVSPSDYPKLVTSLEDSIADQLAVEVRACGDIKSLVILSPFFDPDAQAVADLLAKTNTPEVRIALPLGSEPSTFPFTKTDGWTVKVSAVKSSKQDRRRLHAKWLEWTGSDGILTLTGSINATRQALSDINNIEVGVLRYSPVDEPWVTWRKAPVPDSYRECQFSRSGMRSSLVFGELLENGNLRGQIMSLTSPAGVWSGEIQRSNGDSVELALTVSEAGHFYASNVTADEDFLFASALQIKVQKDGQLARGWITNIAILNLPKSYRISPASLLRLLNREETSEDDVALLEYLAIYALDHLKTFGSRVITKTVSSGETDSEPEVFSIDLELLKPDATHSLADSFVHDRVISTATAFDRLFAQLRRRLLGHVSKRDRIAPTHVGAGVGTDEPDSDEHDATAEKAGHRFDSAFESFMATMKDFAEATDLADEHRRALLVLWVEVGLHMLVRRKHDRAEANAFLRAWFRMATTKTSIRPEVDGLEQHVVTAAAILTANESASESVRVQVHEALERYWKGNVNRERAMSDLLPYSPMSIAALFLEDSQQTLEQYLKRVLDTTTLRHDLESLFRGDSLLPDSAVLQSEAGRSLRDELLKDERRRRIEFVEDGAVCPSEFIKLSEACRMELQRNRVARCSVCGFLIVRITA